MSRCMAGKSARGELLQLWGGRRSTPSSSGRRLPYPICMSPATLGSGNAVQNPVVRDSALWELPFQGSQRRREHTCEPVRSRQAGLTGQGAASVEGVVRRAARNREHLRCELVVRSSPGKEPAHQRARARRGLRGTRTWCVWQTGSREAGRSSWTRNEEKHPLI